MYAIIATGGKQYKVEEEPVAEPVEAVAELTTDEQKVEEVNE